MPFKSMFSESISKTLMVALVAIGSIGPSAAAAAEAKVLILGGEVVDAESGQRSNAILNPSGVAKLTYTTWGLSLSYVGADGKTTALALHADFPEPPPETTDVNVNLRNRMLADTIRAGGILQAGDVLKTMPEQMAVEGKQVALSLNTKNRVGFVVADHGFSDVMVQVDGKPRLSLQQIVMNIISSRVNQHLATVAAAAAVSPTNSGDASAIEAEKKASAVQAFRKQVCEAIFSPPSP